MIGLSTQIFDIDGNFVFYSKDIIVNNLTNSNVERRLSKVKTLDGGVFIEDNGYSAGDVDIIISVLNPVSSLLDKLRDIFVYHSKVIVTSNDGNYLCVPSTFQISNGNAVMKFLTQESA